MSAPANLQPDDDVQGTTVNWVDEEPRLACCVCDNYQQAINTWAAPRFLLQPMQYSPVCGHTGSQCFDEGDHGNWADRWFHGTPVGHIGPGYPSTRVLTSLIEKNLSLCYSIVYYVHKGMSTFLQVGRLFWALTLLGLALCLPSASVSLVFMVLYIRIFLHPSLHLLVS